MTRLIENRDGGRQMSRHGAIRRYKKRDEGRGRLGAWIWVCSWIMSDGEPSCASRGNWPQRDDSLISGSRSPNYLALRGLDCGGV